MSVERVKLRAGKYYIPVQLETREDDRWYFHFGFNRTLIDEIKATFEGRKWHGPPLHNPGEKVWSAPKTQRNRFQLAYMKGKYGTNPYLRFEQSPVTVSTRHPLMGHQMEMVGWGLVTRWFLWAAEMGTGKTLAAFTVMEESGLTDFWWVGPKSALRAVQLEHRKWGLRLEPRYMTYDRLRQVIKDWIPGQPAPQGVIFDESSRLKTPTAQRSIAAKHLADSIREEHGDRSIVGLLSGSPAPKSPADWWYQCEIACPGFIREATYWMFKERLGAFEDRETVAGAGKYRHLNAWLDDENKCGECGKEKEDEVHSDYGITMGTGHKWQPSKNEVKKLYRRMSGLVNVWTKDKCLDLPEKRYELIQCKPSVDTLNAAKLVVASSTRTVEALTRLRELSDGFQYQKRVSGRTECPRCKGTKQTLEYFDPAAPDEPADPDAVAEGVRFTYTEVEVDGFIDYEITGREEITYESRDIDCPCGDGYVDAFERETIQVPTPKEDVLIEQLDLHSEVGRLVVYAGFTGSIDRVSEICLREGWTIIRADGRGWIGQTAAGELLPGEELLDIFAEGHEKYPRVVFIGQPGAAGMGLTLTASPTILFWSNDFNAESRIQAEDRGHRIGMDRERGGRIVDLVHLDSDKYVLANLRKKRKLQHLSMTGLKKLFGADTDVSA